MGKGHGTDTEKRGQDGTNKNGVDGSRKTLLRLLAIKINKSSLNTKMVGFGVR